MRAIERALDDAWGEASNDGDGVRMSVLRSAFERLSLGIDAPVRVSSLTQHQVDRLEDAFPEDRESILASGRSWVVFDSPDTLWDYINERSAFEESAIGVALGGSVVMTPSQEAFATRSALRSVASLIGKLKHHLVGHIKIPPDSLEFTGISDANA